MLKYLLCAMSLAAFELQAAPLFPNSVTSNDIDFIREKDRSAFSCIGYMGTERREMPSKLSNDLFQDGVHVFEMNFKDGTRVEILVSGEIGAKSRAKNVAMQLAGPLGKLPTMMRDPLQHVVINKGDATASAEEKAQFFILYDANMAKRIGTRDLEETVFHETMHASLQQKMLNSAAWKKAVRKDRGFVTEYARTHKGEDFAESGLFAYTALRHPERLGDAVFEGVNRIMPNRIAFFANIFPPKGKEFQKVGPVRRCSG